MYIEIIFLLNFVFDFLILYAHAKILNYQTNLKKIALASLLGELSLILLFIKVSNIISLVIIILLSILMIYIVFSYHNIKYFLKNIIYFYILSTILGGTLNLIKEHIGYGYQTLILLPIIIYILIKELSLVKKEQRYLYDLEIMVNKKTYLLKAYLDSGNNVKDLIFNHNVILVNKRKIAIANKPYYIPINTISNSSMLPCYRVTKIKINNTEIKNCVIGLVNNLNYDALIPVYLERLIYV